MSTSGARKEVLKLHHNTLQMIDWHRSQLLDATGKEIDREEMIIYLCHARKMAIEMQLAQADKDKLDKENEDGKS